MDSDSSEIKTLKRIVWRTAIAGRVARFKAVLDDPEKQKLFGEPFVVAISSRIDRLLRLQLALVAIYIALMISLFVAQDASKGEFQILGYSFKNIGNYKEFLLLAAAITAPLSSIVSAYYRFLTELRKAALQRLLPDSDVFEFTSYLFADEYVDAIIKDNKRTDTMPHGVAQALVLVFGASLLALLVALVVASFGLQLIVILDVVRNPSQPPLVSNFIVAFSLSAIALSWMVGALQLPLPEVDVSAYARLTSLKDADPSRYEQTMKRLAAESARKERLWHVTAGCAVFALVYGSLAVVSAATTPDQAWAHLFGAIPGFALAVVLSPMLAKFLKRKMYASYFRRYPDGTDKSLSQFTSTTRRLGALRAFLAVSAAGVYSLFVLRMY
jgi:hypothetical protein